MRKIIPCFISICFLFHIAQAEQFIVTSNADNGPGTLREAILKAGLNGDAQTDNIVFNIPGSTVISLESQLPLLTSNLIIDGTTQPGPGEGLTNVKITLIRATALYFHGLMADKVHDVQIFGMKFANFKSDLSGSIPLKKGAVFMSESINIQVGDVGKENIFINNSIGIYSPVDAGIVENIIISANLVGLEADGSPVPNENGIDLSYPKNTLIGGPTRQHGNIVSGNISQAIGCGGAQGTITIQNNLVGVNADASKSYESAKGIGIYANGPAAVFYIFDNVIGGQETGILVDNVNNHFRITGNYIGTGFAGTENFENASYGIKIFNCTNGGLIGGGPVSEKNYIANNDYGIFIERNSMPVTISRNSIFCNRILGIAFKDLPLTPETPKIGVITANSATGTYLPNSTIELFYDDNCPNCEGKTFLISILADSQGNWSYNGPINGNLVATGTASAITSGFSSPVLDQSQLQIEPSFCEANNGSIKYLRVSDASVFNWYDAAGILVGTGKDLLNVPPGRYQLLAGQPNGCFLKTPFYTVEPRMLNFEADVFIIKPANCGQDNGSVSVTSFKTDSPTQYRWLDPLGRELGTGRDIAGLPAGTFTLIGSNGRGCENVAGTFTIPRNEPGAIDLSGTVITSNCDNSLASIHGVKFDDLNGPYTFSWRDNNNQEVGSQLNLTNVPPASYSLTITDSFNCAVSSEPIDLTRPQQNQLIIPTAFTPNGDGVNDFWNITNADNYPEGTFDIYNRYGQRVFASRGYHAAFDGYRDSKQLPVGTYYYIITLNTGCPPVTGSLTIIR